MKHTTIWSFALYAILAGACSIDHRSEADRRIDELMAQMTLQEKIGQMIQLTSDMDVTGERADANCLDEIRAGRCGSLLNIVGIDMITRAQKVAVEESRLGIPIVVGYDVIHGYRTCFPIPLGENASWDLEAIERDARVAALEASADGIAWTFAPMCDVSVEPRWGRVMEGSTEDAFLSASVSAARVRGFQGDDLSDTSTVAACVKHFAAYGAPLAGREYNTVEMTRRKFMEFYLPSYEAAIRAGAATVMTSFNDFEDMPASGNHFLMKDILREHLGFDGMLVTDYNAVAEMINYGVALDKKEAAQLSIDCEVDMDMVSQSYLELEALVKEGKVSEAQIDKGCRRVLKLKYDLGLLDDPYRYCNASRRDASTLTPENLAAAQEMAEKSFVLLKNEGNVLPLKKGCKVALIGALADSPKDMRSSWAAQCRVEDCESLYEKMKEYNGAENVTYVRGCAPHDASRKDFPLALSAASKADVVVLVIGERGNNSGEGESRADIRLTGVQTELLGLLSGLGKPVVTVLMNGRPMDISAESALSDAVLETWFAGSRGGTAITRTLFGEVNPSGKLPMTFPRCLGQVPIYHYEKPSSRPSKGMQYKYRSNYRDVDNSPLYPFGHGLSYTTFSYSPISLSAETIPMGGSIEARVTVTNSGERAGAEVVQLYVGDVHASIVRPMRQLKGFQRIELAPGESREICFEIGMEALSFWNNDLRKVAEPGELKIYIGGSSATDNSASFTLI